MSEISKVIASEIADFFAGFGGPGEPNIQSGEAQRLLTDRVLSVLALRKEREAAVPVAYISKADLDAGYPHILARKDYSKACPMAVFAAPPAQPVAVPDISAAKYYTEDGAFKAFDYKRDLNSAMLAAPGKPVAAGWIACSERMPELNTRVLLYFPDYGGHIEDGCIGDEGDGHYHYFFDGDSLMHEPTHWMPLPAAPGKEG